MLEEILQGDPSMAWAAIGVVVGVAVLEAVATTRGWGPYFRWGFPLGVTLVPLQQVPPESGSRAGVAFRSAEDGASRTFWSTRRAASLPRGVHGRVDLKIDQAGRVHLDVRWAPWWTPMAALVWLAVLGASRGDGPFAGAIATLIMGVWLVVYQRAAERAVRLLVVGWASPPDHSQGGRSA